MFLAAAEQTEPCLVYYNTILRTRAFNSFGVKTQQEVAQDSIQPVISAEARRYVSIARTRLIELVVSYNGTKITLLASATHHSLS